MIFIGNTWNIAWEDDMKKRVRAILAAVVMLVGILSGCADKEKDSYVEKTEPVEVTFYIRKSPAKDSDRIMKKANEIIEKEIGVHLNLIMVEPTIYTEKMNLLIQSGGAWDLCFVSNWIDINYYENAQKGAFADLTELLPELAPETYGRIPERLWNGVKVDGRIYAFVNYQQWGAVDRSGFHFRKDLAEETGFDWASLKGKPTLEVLEKTGEFIGKALELHPDMIGWETISSFNIFANGPLYWDMEEVGEISTPGWIRYEEPDKVINQFETEEFMEFCKIMRDWYQKGYVRKDGATIIDASEDRKAGKFVAEFTTGWPDSVDFPENLGEEAMSMTAKEDAPAVTISNTRTVIKAGNSLNAAVAVNARSKNVEKAVELMELLNTNDDLYKLIAYGEEGVDYRYDEEGYFHEIKGNYSLDYNEWQIGQSYSPDFNRACYDKNERGELRKKMQQMLYDTVETADESPLTGFAFDASPVKTQILGCQAVTKELVPALGAGSVDPETAVPELIERLKAAGVDKIIREKQRQLDEWRSSKTK